MRLFFIFVFGLFLIGCGQDKNVDFFMNNRDEIESTLSKCDASIEFAIKTKDEKRYKEVVDSLECKSAKNARYEIMRLQKEEENRIRNEQEKLYDEKVGKFYDELMNYDADKLLSKVRELQESCKIGNVHEEIRYQCDTFSRKKSYIKNRLTEVLNESFHYDELLEKESNNCSERDLYKPSVECGAIKAARDIAFKNQINAAKNNIESLKITYNSCVDRYQKAKKTSGHQAARNVGKEHECQIANYAAKELELVSGFSVFTHKIN